MTQFTMDNCKTRCILCVRQSVVLIVQPFTSCAMALLSRTETLAHYH